MAEFRLKQIADWTGGRILQGDPSRIFTGFSIDSRRIHKNELFFAISGERDGHDFIEHALQKGAAGAVVSRAAALDDSSFCLIKVDDTLRALQKLSSSVLEKHSIRVIGITGSTGKTTTKEFTSYLLSQRFRVLKSEGNYNNHIGLPLSILNLQPEHEIAVLEYGMNSPGEIAALTEIAPPDVAVVTNVHPVHMEFFEGLDEIALAKQEILSGMRSGGTAVLNQDDPRIRKMDAAKAAKVIRFGTGKEGDVKARNIRLQGWEKIDFELYYSDARYPASIPFFNRSYLYNFLAAAAVCLEFSIPAEDVISRAKDLRPFDKRGLLYFLGRDIKLIDDSYNSNPAALDEALKSLAVFPGRRRVAVLGDMLELGEKEKPYHLEAGQIAAKLGIDLLITAGGLAHYFAEGAAEAGLPEHRIYSYPDSDAAAEKFPALVKPGDVILVKGSRGVKMEKIVDALKRMT